MTIALGPARPLDAGATGDILHAFETGTSWMPKQHSAAEAVAFCSHMIDRGWVTVAREPAPSSCATLNMGQGSGGGMPGAPPLPPRQDLSVGRDGRPVVQGFLARDGEDILALYVRPSQTGRGIGRALMQAAKARCPRLRLWTFQANIAAQRFYLREGFAEAARTDGAGNDEGLPDIHYIWERRAA